MLEMNSNATSAQSSPEVAPTTVKQLDGRSELRRLQTKTVQPTMGS